jgi:hypothetical protein
MALKQLLEGAAHMPFTGLISNPNLMGETSLATISAGHEMILSYARSLQLPIRYLTVEEKFFAALHNEYGEILQAISLYLKPDWL